MDREILFKAKHEHVVVANKDLEGQWVEGLLWDEDYIYSKDLECEMLIDKNTICSYTGLHDKNGKRIWENDILMCHDNPKDLVKAVFGEFNVIEVESEEVIDSVIGYHNGFIGSIYDAMYPITMPYTPADKPDKIVCDELLTDPKNGDYDTKAIIYIEKPDGKKVKINRYFKESEESFKEISWLEYQIRRYKDWRRRKWLGNDEERHS